MIDLFRNLGLAVAICIMMCVQSSSAWGSTQFGLYLTGGGAGAETFTGFLQDAGGGDIVVLKASTHAKDWYEDNLPRFGEVGSVTTLILDSRSKAMSQTVYEKIMAADGLFLAGGNQAKYHRFWKGTPVEDAINEQLQALTPVGGSSAGLAILGEYYFSAEQGGLSSDYAERNPDSDAITLRTDFLTTPFLQNLITDTHFSERERLGRLQVFRQRILQDFGQPVRGLGVDEATTLVIRQNGEACVIGDGSAFIVASEIKEYASGACFQMGQLD